MSARIALRNNKLRSRLRRQSEAATWDDAALAEYDFKLGQDDLAAGDPRRLGSTDWVVDDDLTARTTTGLEVAVSFGVELVVKTMLVGETALASIAAKFAFKKGAPGVPPEACGVDLEGRLELAAVL